MKKPWKNLLSLCLVASLMLTIAPPVGALTNGESAIPEQTSSADWGALLQDVNSEITLPKEGTYAPNRLIVTRVNTGRRMAQINHSSIISSNEIITAPLPEEAQEAAQTYANNAETVTCSAVNLAEGSDLLAVMNEISHQEGVLAVEFDNIYSLDAEPAGEPVIANDAEFNPEKDPFVAQQTWLDFMGATKAWDMLEANDTVPGEEVVVAVLDTGITTEHPDLKAQIAEGGKSFLRDETNHENTIISDYVEDGHGHGTHVSGIIAGAKNGTGIMGVAYGAQILPIKILDDDGYGGSIGIIAAMGYLAGLSDENGNSVDVPARCDIANMSIGSNNGTRMFAYEIAASAMRAKGIFLVVAAGNEDTATDYVTPTNTYAKYSAPAYFSGAFTVMAMQEKPGANGDYLANFSNWDSEPYAGAEYSIMAPGTEMLSAVNTEGGTYDKFSGTSMASPAVAGAAALILSENPTYTAEDLWSVLATSGKKLQGKTDADGTKYYYNSLDVVAALNTTPEAVKSVVKGMVSGNLIEPTTAVISGDVLMLPTDGSLPQINLSLRGYDAEASEISVECPELTEIPTVDTLMPGQIKTLEFELKAMPTSNVFKTTINITWKNNDGSTGRETIPVELDVVKAAPGEKLTDLDYIKTYEDKNIPIMWIFTGETTLTLAPTQEPEIYGGMYYFEKEGSLTIEGDKELALLGGVMRNPQLYGNISLDGVDITSDGARAISDDDKANSIIDIDGSMIDSTIYSYDDMSLTVGEDILESTIANCAYTQVKAKSIMSSSLIHNYAYMEDDAAPIELTVTEPAHKGNGIEDDLSTGFYGNAVEGPAKLLDYAGAPATALDCYFIQAPKKGDNDIGVWVADEFNKIDCAEDSKVYIEGTTAGERPETLENCPAILISTNRVEGKPVGSHNDTHISYMLESVYSSDARPVDPKTAITYTSLAPPYGGLPVTDLEWAEDGKSCTYTVYTSADNLYSDDAYALIGIDTVKQYDLRNPISNKEEMQQMLAVKHEIVENGIKLSWEYPEGFEDEDLINTGIVMHSTGDTAPVEHKLTSEEIKAKSVTLEMETEERSIYNVGVLLGNEHEAIIAGFVVFASPSVTLGDAISLVDNAGKEVTQLNLAGTSSTTFLLRADKSFNLKDGMKISIALDGKALQLKVIAPTDKTLFAGVAQVGNEAVAEIAPTLASRTGLRDKFVLKGETIATITLQAKNVQTKDGTLLIALEDFFGNNIVNEKNEGIAFALTTNTEQASGTVDTAPSTDSGT